MHIRNLVIALCLGICATPLTVTAAEASTLTVAFVGDQGTSKQARDVLQLIKDEGTDLLLLQGDLGYEPGSAAQWIANIDQILGDEFPVLLTVGNHEVFEWLIYRQWLLRRIEAVPELRCNGNPGVKAHCSFRGLSIVQTAPGVSEVAGVDALDNYAAYIEKKLANDANVWRICSFHKNQQTMQVGGKLDETGWDVYTACLKHGAIVATAHEHSYARTFLMNDFENHGVAHRNNHLEISPGNTFAFVSGLGGRKIRAQQLSGDWWASVYSATQNASHGALFCTFRDKRANCQFKDIAGAVPDQFTLATANLPGNNVVFDDVTPIDEALYAYRSDPSTGSAGLLLILALVFLILKRKAGKHYITSCWSSVACPANLLHRRTYSSSSSGSSSAKARL